MPYKNPVEKICKNCGELFETKGNTTKWCADCKIIIKNEQTRKYRRTHIVYHRERNRIYGRKNKKKKVICKSCDENKIHDAFGFCSKCYQRYKVLYHTVVVD